MTDTPEQAQLRRHLAELRHAFGAVGRDAELHVRDLPSKIDRLGTKVGKEAKYAAWEIEDDLSALEHGLKKGAVTLPGKVANGVVAGASAAAGAVSGAAGWTRDTISDGAHRASEGTRDAFARAAGVKRKPMKTWHPPTGHPVGDDE
jgi:hypothetical protein